MLPRHFHKLLIVLLLALLTACGGGNKKPVPVDSYGGKAKQSQTKSKTPTSYKVKKGDTLYSISFRYGVDYKTLAKNNNIKSPYTIYIGQKLSFNSSKKTRSTTKKTSTKSSKKTASNKKKTSTKPSSSSSNNSKLTWQWPTQGKVTSSYSKNATGRKGINIAGKSGQKVVASATGKVVYSGNGLPKYGNLLIIKHNDVYLSAYAHNKTLLVKEGQQVKAGQKIAELGRTGTKKNELHFEIRRNGKPVDPMRFLPKR